MTYGLGFHGLLLGCEAACFMDSGLRVHWVRGFPFKLRGLGVMI